MLQPSLTSEQASTLDCWIRQSKLLPVREVIQAHATQCVRLHLGHRVGNVVRRGQSRAYGLPDLASIQTWPRTSEGKLAQFVCQVNLDEIQPVAGSPLPSSGLLSLFVLDDSEPAWLAQAVVIYQPSADELLPPLVPSDVPEYLHPDGISPHLLEPIWGIDFSLDYQTVIRPCSEIMASDDDLRLRLDELHRTIRRWKGPTWVSRLLGVSWRETKARFHESSSWISQLLGNSVYEPFGKLLGAMEKDLSPQAELVTTGRSEIVFDWKKTDDQLHEALVSKNKMWRKNTDSDATVEAWRNETLRIHDAVRAFRPQHESFRRAIQDWRLLFEIDSHPIVGLNIWDAWKWKFLVKNNDLRDARFDNGYFCATPDD